MFFSYLSFNLGSTVYFKAWQRPRIEQVDSLLICVLIAREEESYVLFFSIWDSNGLVLYPEAYVFFIFKLLRSRKICHLPCFSFLSFFALGSMFKRLLSRKICRLQCFSYLSFIALGSMFKRLRTRMICRLPCFSFLKFFRSWKYD